MYMDTEFPVNISQVMRVVDEAEVFVVGFLLFGERLLVDTRSTSEEGPVVKVVPGVSSIEERYEALREMRPNLPLPEKFVFLVWPRSVSALDRLSIWGRILDRLVASGAQARECYQEAFEELRRLELSRVMAALRGEGFRSIWGRGQDYPEGC